MKHYEDKGCNVDLLVWYKTNPLPTCNNKYLSDLEYCVFAREPNLPLFGTYETKSKVFMSSANVEDKEQYGHPTIKPLERLKHFIINSSKKGDIVFDPFAGSGSTLVAAKQLDRRYLGFEIEPKWHKVAFDRLNGINQKGQMSLLETNFEQLDLFEGE